MKQIPLNVVDERWKKATEIPLENAQAYVDEFSRTQSGLVAYLLGTGSEEFSPADREYFFYLGFLIWNIMKGETPDFPTVADDVIDRIYHSNEKLMTEMGEMDEENFNQAAGEMVAGHPQKFLLMRIVEALFEPLEEGEEVDEFSRGLMLVYLKTVIESLDQAL